jgi:hypothetical protein
MIDTRRGYLRSAFAKVLKAGCRGYTVGPWTGTADKKRYICLHVTKSLRVGEGEQSEDPNNKFSGSVRLGQAVVFVRVFLSVDSGTSQAEDLEREKDLAIEAVDMAVENWNASVAEPLVTEDYFLEIQSMAMGEDVAGESTPDSTCLVQLAGIISFKQTFN